MRQAILYRDEDGVWIAEVPSLPGCVSQGATQEDAIRNVTEAAELWIETMKELGRPVPQDDMSATVALLPLNVA
ncbi:HicB family protein [Phycisphaerae bacterium]|jgi:predicted RNase H-like HicB family nuclease|nr:HicB family protein [Phycisphaerae bacterium]